MELDKFIGLPDSSSIWIFGFQQKLSEREKSLVERILSPSVANWISHRSPVDGEYFVFRDRFVILAGHCRDGISGCSIDGMMHVFRALESSYGLSALGGERIFFLNKDNEIESLTRSEFRDLASSGNIDENLLVFDLTLQKLADLREGKFIRRLGDSWHAKLIAAATRQNSEISAATREGI